MSVRPKPSAPPVRSRAAGVRSRATLQDKISAAGGATRGFDYLRLLLAGCVVMWHSLETSYGPQASVGVWTAARPLISLILPMFFALSGFLVCGSLVRTRSLVVFLSHRVLRLIPALLVEILLSAFLLGPLLSEVSRPTYFSSSEFFSYFFNIVGFIHYRLPGVFLHNPTPYIVNKSLWTIPYELECYVSLMVVAILGLIRRRVALTSLLIFACLTFAILTNLHHSAVLRSVGPPGRLLVLSFLGGVVLYLWREVIPASLGLFAAALATALLLLSFPQTMFLAAVPVAYVTTYLGLLNPARIRFLMDGDYSYGLYLFAYPLQQAYSQLFTHHRSWVLNTVFALVAGLAYAVFSWNVVEKRVLSHRKALTAWLNGLTARFDRRTAALLGRGRRGRGVGSALPPT